MYIVIYLKQKPLSNNNCILLNRNMIHTLTLDWGKSGSNISTSKKVLVIITICVLNLCRRHKIQDSLFLIKP